MDAKTYLTTLERLTTSSDPVSFYDVWLLLRQTKRLSQLPETVLGALLTLHDAAQLTDGGRDVLADYLRGYANTMHEERQRAQGPIQFEHSGRRVRAAAGDVLELLLLENRQEGFRWKPLVVHGALRLERGDNKPGFACMQLSPKKPGTYELVLQETRPPQIDEEHPEGKPRRFELWVVVE